jgi:hypothetical protein
MNLEPAFTVPQKRCRPHTDYAVCLICQKGPDSQRGPLQKLTSQGYPAFLYAVNNRKDEVSFRLESDVDTQSDLLSKNPVYHARCRSNYTNRKTVDQKKSQFAKQESTSSTGCSPELEGSSRTRSSTPQSVHYKDECFICGKARSTKGDRCLLLIACPERQNAMWKKANELADEQMLHKIRGFDKCTDMVAGDFQYHRHCMTTYLNRRARQSSTETSPYDAALNQLLADIDEPLFKDGSIFFMTTLRDKYRLYLIEQGVDDAQSYRSQSLRARIETEYGDRIMVVPQRGSSSLICSAELSIGCLMTKLKELKERVDEEEYAEESDDEMPQDDTMVSAYHTARRIRMELQEQSKTEKQALKAAQEARTSEHEGEHEGISPQMQISYSEASDRVSNNLYNLSAWLITDLPPEVGDDGRVHVSPQQHEQVLNLAQDVCKAVAGIPTPKHVGTALHILKETRSKATVTLLNRFGNCISYQDAQRYITTMAEAVDELPDRAP